MIKREMAKKGLKGVCDVQMLVAVAEALFAAACSGFGGSQEQSALM